MRGSSFAVLSIALAVIHVLHGCGGSSSTTPSPGSGPAPSPDPSPSPSPGPSTTTTPPPSPPPSPCIARPDPPTTPEGATDFNGKEWPQACFEQQSENHFFIIGDWGGMCGFGPSNHCAPKDSDKKYSEHALYAHPKPMPNGNRGKVNVADDNAQYLVAAAMEKVAGEVKPEFLLNVGDNFYPGSIIEHCEGRADHTDFKRVPHQFQTTYEDIYDGPALKDKEWMGVLGNHDYGGVCYNMGWPQQIFYSWNEVSKRWVLPGQYWSRQIRWSKTGGKDWTDEDFSADIFFIDSNFHDDETEDPNHGICYVQGNTPPGYYCKGFLGDDESGSCPGTDFTGGADGPKNCNALLKQLWEDEMKWLDEGLARSTADWQIVVTHFPPHYPEINATLNPLAAKHGIDLIVTGHTHMQQLFYRDDHEYDSHYGDTAWVISGGGGGIWSESPSAHDNSNNATGDDDQYGFMDVTISKEKLIVQNYCWGKNEDGSIKKRKKIEVSPRKPAPTAEALAELLI